MSPQYLSWPKNLTFGGGHASKTYWSGPQFWRYPGLIWPKNSYFENNFRTTKQRSFSTKFIRETLLDDMLPNSIFNKIHLRNFIRWYDEFCLPKLLIYYVMFELPIKVNTSKFCNAMFAIAMCETLTMLTVVRTETMNIYQVVGKIQTTCHPCLCSSALNRRQKLIRIPYSVTACVDKTITNVWFDNYARFTTDHRQEGPVEEGQISLFSK